MHRRSFLKGAAALAVAPAVPTLPMRAASAPLVTMVPAAVIAEGTIRANCLVVTDACMRVFDSAGPARILFGVFDDALAAEPRDLAISRGGVVVPA